MCIYVYIYEVPITISIMQYFIPEVVFIDQCILNRCSGAISASLFS